MILKKTSAHAKEFKAIYLQQDHVKLQILMENISPLYSTFLKDTNSTLTQVTLCHEATPCVQ